MGDYATHRGISIRKNWNIGFNCCWTMRTVLGKWGHYNKILYDTFLNGIQQWVIMRHIAEYQSEKTEILVSIAAEPHIFHQLIVAYWRHTQVMAWCLTAPSHYLNQCWLLISEVLWHSSENKSTARAQAIILHNELKSYVGKLLSYHPGAIVLSLFTPRTKHHVCTHEKISIMEYVRVHDNIFLSMTCNA